MNENNFAFNIIIKYYYMIKEIKHHELNCASFTHPQMHLQRYLTTENHQVAENVNPQAWENYISVETILTGWLYVNLFLLHITLWEIRLKNVQKEIIHFPSMIKYS